MGFHLRRTGFPIQMNSRLFFQETITTEKLKTKQSTESFLNLSRFSHPILPQHLSTLFHHSIPFNGATRYFTPPITGRPTTTAYSFSLPKKAAPPKQTTIRTTSNRLTTHSPNSAEVKFDCFAKKKNLTVRARVRPEFRNPRVVLVFFFFFACANLSYPRECVLVFAKRVHRERCESFVPRGGVRNES